MTDYLKEKSVEEVAAWYYRLVDLFAAKKVEGSTPLSSIFLKHWLDNRSKDAVYKFKAPAYLQNSTRVHDVLKYHRAVFMTEKKARVGKNEIWAGIKPRLNGTGGHQPWIVGTPLAMHYESLCDIAPTIRDIIAIQKSGTDAERDLFASLRGFQLRSDVIVMGALLPDKKVKIVFQSWMSCVSDTYDWNYSEHLMVPNPDYQSKSANAVRPTDSTLKVYHINAKRLEDAGLAAPYAIKSDYWGVTYPDLLAKTEISK